MKTLRTYIFLSLWLVSLSLIAAPAGQQPSANRHYITVWGGVGYSNMLHSITDSKAVGGIGGEIGLGFEYDRRNLLLHTGVEFQYLTSLTRLTEMPEQTIPFAYTPLAGHTLDYHYRFSSVSDRERTALVNVPLLIGYRFADDYFVMGGVRIGMSVLARSKTLSDVHISFSDEAIPAVIDNVGHFTGDYSAEQSGKLTFGLNIAPSIELGMYLDRWIQKQSDSQPQKKTKGKRKPQRLPNSYRLSLFAECNVLNINKSNAVGTFLDMDDMTLPDDLHLNPLLASQAATDKAVRNLFAGVRFTALFSLDKEKKRRSAGGRTNVTHRPQQPKKLANPVVQNHKPPVEQQDTVVRFGDVVVEEEQPIVLENLMFDFNTSNIIAESHESLDMLLRMLTEHPTVGVHIIGHTDNMGTAQYNQRLSENRADAVRTYLIENGIAPNRITTEGRGASQPIADNDTDAGRQRNRRVEFIIRK